MVRKKIKNKIIYPALGVFFLLLTLQFLVKGLQKSQLIGSRASTDNNVSVTVDPQKTGLSVPVYFVGFSAAKPKYCDLVSEDQQTSVLSNLLKNLSPGVLSLSPTAKMTWSADGTCGDVSMTPKVADGVISLAQKVNYKLIWGITLKDNPTDKIVVEAKYVSGKAGQSLLSTELGQEPEQFWKEAETAEDNYNLFNTRWKGVADSLKSNNYSGSLSGPSSLIFSPWLKNFLRDEAQRIKFSTHHFFPLGVKTVGSDGVAPIIKELLSTGSMLNFSGNLDQVINESKKYNLVMRINGSNNIAHGGLSGVSDTFASALWATDYLFTNLEHGTQSVIFHGNPASPDSGSNWVYSPIKNASSVTGKYEPYAAPEYYGLLLFKFAAKNGKVVPVQFSTSLNIAAHSVLNTDGTLQIVLINKEAVVVSVNINTTRTYSSAKITRLLSPSVTTTITSPNDNKITLGGSPVSANGTWNPVNQPTLTLNGSRSKIWLQPYSAAVISFTP